MMARPGRDDRPRFALTRLFYIGLALLAGGTGPLLAVVVAAKLGLTRDPDPNPIGLGLLALLTFWPSVIMMGASFIGALDRYKTAKRLAAKPSAAKPTRKTP